MFAEPKDKELIFLDDMLEVKNHFRLFDYMLDTINQPLSKKMMIQMNVILKRGTSFEDNPAYNVGGFKLRENQIGQFKVMHTTKPKDVEKEIDFLLKNYTNKKMTLFLLC